MEPPGHSDPEIVQLNPNWLAKCFLLQNCDGWCFFSLGRDLICVAMEHFQSSTTKGDISNIPWEGFKAFSSFLKSFSALFWCGRKVLHASSHPLLWQLHLMSAKWSEKHPLVWVAGWWQGRGDAEIGAVKSCTHLLRRNSCPSGLYQAARCMASKPNKTCRPASHAPLLQTARWRFNWISQAVVAGGSSMDLSKSFMYLSYWEDIFLAYLTYLQLTNSWGKKTNFK